MVHLAEKGNLLTLLFLFLLHCEVRPAAYHTNAQCQSSIPAKCDLQARRMDHLLKGLPPPSDDLEGGLQDDDDAASLASLPSTTAGDDGAASAPREPEMFYPASSQALHEDSPSRLSSILGLLGRPQRPTQESREASMQQAGELIMERSLRPESPSHRALELAAKAQRKQRQKQQARSTV